jgi:type I restriction enzyme R subunit
VEVQQGNIDKKLVYAHPTFAKPTLDYIITEKPCMAGFVRRDSVTFATGFRPMPE